MIQKNYEALRYNKIDLRELKIPRSNEILTPNRFFYFRPSVCNIFSIARRPRGPKKPQIHCYLCRTIIKRAVCTNWCGVCLFHTWRFLSSPILEICIFFLPILWFLWMAALNLSFVRGPQPVLNSTVSDRCVWCDGSVKWTDSKQQSEFIKSFTCTS